MSRELIVKIKMAEERSAQDINDAKAEARRIIAQAEKDSQLKSADLLKRTEEDGKIQIENVRQKAEAKCLEITSAAAKEAEQIYNDALQKMPSAVEMIMKKVVE